MKKQTSLFFFAGETSGDMYGAQLIHALEKVLGPIQCSGVAGPKMSQFKGFGPLTMHHFNVMGFSDVFRSLPRLWRQFQQIRQQIISQEPEAVVFIDSPSFSLRMAKALRKNGYRGKIIQYISPTVWAWGKKRVAQIAKDFDLLLTIYPFEAAYFAKTNLSVEFIGHPLEQILQSHHYCEEWKDNLGIPPESNLLALFPGSRAGEISRNLPKQLKAATLLKQAFPNITIAISSTDEKGTALIREEAKRNHLIEKKDFLLVPKNYSYELMRACRAAIAKSGTVTLELALHCSPTVVTYELTLLNRLIAKYLLKVNLPHYCIVNILAKECVYPELIGEEFSAETIVERLLPLYTNELLRKKIEKQCMKVQQLLSPQTDIPSYASTKAALAIKKLLQESS